MISFLRCAGRSLRVRMNTVQTGKLAAAQVRGGHLFFWRSLFLVGVAPSAGRLFESVHTYLHLSRCLRRKQQMLGFSRTHHTGAFRFVDAGSAFALLLFEAGSVFRFAA